MWVYIKNRIRTNVKTCPTRNTFGIISERVIQNKQRRTFKTNIQNDRFGTLLYYLSIYILNYRVTIFYNNMTQCPCATYRFYQDGFDV